MLRYQVFLTYGVAFLSVWSYCLIRKDEFDLSPTVSLMVTFAPALAVIVLGIFLLARLILGVLAYQDCPEAAREIDIQIAEAKAEMNRRKVYG